MRVREIRQRYDVLKLVIADQTDYVHSPKECESMARTIYDALKDDAYFVNSGLGLLPEHILTVQQIKYVRNSLDMLETVSAVSWLALKIFVGPCSSHSHT